jgi:MYXO-CTERM domain-containing protein
MKALLRGSLATLLGSAALLAAPAAFAAGEPCFNDTDCAGGGMVCGGDVCNWNMLHAAPVGDMKYTCNPAGTDAKGMDGWCTSTNGNDNCKCKDLGAKCSGVHCTFTKPDQAPPGAGMAGSTGAGGGSGTAGSSTGGSSAAGSAAKPAADEGGCSVSVPGNTAGGALALASLVGLGLAFARRRRAS